LPDLLTGLKLRMKGVDPSGAGFETIGR